MLIGGDLSHVVSTTASAHTKMEQTRPWLNVIRWISRTSFLIVASLLALLPSVMKMYETSHWFREGDPSVYDEAKDWFSDPAIPFQVFFDSSKVLMRVYFFIIPYILSALCVAIALSIQAIPSPISLGDRMQKSRHVFGSVLRRTLKFPSFLARVGMPLRVSVGEVLCTISFLMLNIATMVVRVRRSLPAGSRKISFLVDSDEDASKEAIDPYSWQACEVWAKTLGVISILNLGWYLLMPIGRKSVFVEALGMSWERAVKYHRWVGYYSVVIMAVHSILYMSLWVYGDGHPTFDPDSKMAQRNMVPWYCSMNECNEDEARQLRVNMYGFVTLALIMIMTAFALPWVRRIKFEWFYYVHHLFILVLLFVCLHYKGAIIYLVPGIAVYAVDKLIAMYSYHKMAPVTTRMASSDVLEVSFKIAPGIEYKAGDYIFLNVPSVSFLQWHPFSLTSSPTMHGKKVFFHIKNVGDWTNQVIEEAAKQGDGSNLQVRLDGFYGENNGGYEQFQTKDGVIFVGGGIGVTPMISLALEMCEANTIPVTLMWVVRTIDEFAIFSTELAEAQRRYGHFVVKTWITLSSMEPNDAGMFDKSKLLELDNLGQAECILKSLKSIKKSKFSGMKDTPTAFPLFILDHQGLSGASNAAVMTISMLLALVAFALATKISRTDSFANGIQDNISLMELAMVFLFVVLWILVTIVFRRALVRYRGIDKVINGTDHTEKVDDSMRGTVEEMAQKVNHRGNGNDVEDPLSNNEALQSIMSGNIGCRPNISDEFSSFAKVVALKMGRPADIAVLACGPPKLVESINNCINVPSTYCSLGVEKNQQTFYSFTEEDWEW